MDARVNTGKRLKYILYKIKIRSLKCAVTVLMRKRIGHTAVSATSVTLLIWQHGGKENHYIFSAFNRIVDTKTISILGMKRKANYMYI